MSPKKPKLTATSKVNKFRTFLELLRDKRYHEPDSDGYEYCKGCGNSPYWHPKHKEGCFVVMIRELLEETK